MPRGTRHILTGTLCLTALGYVLEMDDGGVWRLDFDTMRGVKRFRGKRMTVEGIRSGFDLLDVQRLDVPQVPDAPSNR